MRRGKDRKGKERREVRTSWSYRSLLFLIQDVLKEHVS